MPPYLVTKVKVVAVEVVKKYRKYSTVQVKSKVSYEKFLGQVTFNLYCTVL